MCPAGGRGNSTRKMLKVTRNNQAEEANTRTNMVAEHVGFKTNQEDRLRIAKARKDLFKYASDKKHKALLRQVRQHSPHYNQGTDSEPVASTSQQGAFRIMPSD